MRYKFIFFLLFFSLPATLLAQNEPKSLRIVDTLTPQEKKSRNPIILRSELDSLIRLHDSSVVKQQPVQLPAKEEKNDNSMWLIVALSLTIILAGALVWLFYQQRKKFDKITNDLSQQLRNLAFHATTSNGTTNEKEKQIISDMQTKTRDLNTRLEKLRSENESLNAVLKEYHRTQAEYESLVKTISKTFKVNKYPGSSVGASEIEALLSLFETEQSFTTHVYEQFIKPITSIVDANKNNPTNISKEQQDKLLELLISLSLLYIEYLYLRVNELSVGGNMVQRINDIKNGLKLNPSLLKKLNTQNGSRALVLRLALEKINLNNLSYPVFEETDLNHH